ncbi:lipase member H-like [Toxorhynchites rutilus septentrionalis]|uniref:lipase member H-like n=1 Tax=Toxorhynchites rutilus septentrionalis TaxID=329112 RepID=UPI00247B045D|nr:lipase member H-like [Toxorhynchites rutilus septentrionalis]
MVSPSLRALCVVLLHLARIGGFPLSSTESNGTTDWVLIPTVTGELVWTHPLVVEAQSRSWDMGESEIEFVFFSRRNSIGTALKWNELHTLGNDTFVGMHPTRIIIHGWQNSRYSPINFNIRETYLIMWDYNIVVVDWSKCALNWNYISAASCVEIVGRTLARVLVDLETTRGMSLDNVYLIGHSLGAHIAGIAGKYIPRGKVSTIVGLDPAFPLFYLDRPNNRVATGDATYVEIIHTNGGILGFRDPLGSADFYPNGGITQPGCGLNIGGLCSHSRSWKLFVESLLEPEENLMAERIGSLGDLPAIGLNRIGRAKLGGEPSNAACGVLGLYYINTNDRSPYFGKHHRYLSQRRVRYTSLLAQREGVNQHARPELNLNLQRLAPVENMSFDSVQMKSSSKTVV